MATLLRTYATPEAAHVAVERMLASGVSGGEIGLLEPGSIHNHLNDTVRNYAGRIIDRRGAFAGPPHLLREGAGTFAGDASCQRRGGFDDVDRETVTTFDGGVPHVHVTSHRGVCEFVVGAGLDASDADELLSGHALVLLRGRAASV